MNVLAYSWFFDEPSLILRLSLSLLYDFFFFFFFFFLSPRGGGVGWLVGFWGILIFGSNVNLWDP